MKGRPSCASFEDKKIVLECFQLFKCRSNKFVQPNQCVSIANSRALVKSLSSLSFS